MPTTDDELVSRLSRLAAMEQELRSFRETAVRIEAALRRLEDKVDGIQTEKRVEPKDFDKLEGRLRLVEVGLAGVGIYGGWTQFVSP